MRKLLGVLGLAVALAYAPQARADDDDYEDEAQAQQNAQVNQQVFQQQLSAYGQWEPDSNYGEVFYPSVAAGWRPYTYGRWVWTSYGWMWDSEEPFGWATFHYGRWWWNPYRHAWGWVPGYEWAPAWVVWRFGGVSVGWAPLYVGYDAWVDSYPVYYDHWVYVPCEHFYGGPVYRYVYSPSYVRTVFYSTAPAHGYVGTTAYGPPTTYVAAHSAVPIATTPVTHASSPSAAIGGHGSSGAVAVYQPPTTHVYNPSRPAAAPIRGPGAARQPVVAPAGVHPGYNGFSGPNAGGASGFNAGNRPGSQGANAGGASGFNAGSRPGSQGANAGGQGAPIHGGNVGAPGVRPNGAPGSFGRPNEPVANPGQGGFNGGSSNPGSTRPGYNGGDRRPSFGGTPSNPRPGTPYPTTPVPNNRRPGLNIPPPADRPGMNGGARPANPGMSAPHSSFGQPGSSGNVASARPSFGGGSFGGGHPGFGGGNFGGGHAMPSAAPSPSRSSGGSRGAPVRRR